AEGPSEQEEYRGRDGVLQNREELRGPLWLRVAAEVVRGTRVMGKSRRQDIRREPRAPGPAIFQEAERLLQGPAVSHALWLASQYRVLAWHGAGLHRCRERCAAPRSGVADRQSLFPDRQNLPDGL